MVEVRWRLVGRFLQHHRRQRLATVVLHTSTVAGTTTTVTGTTTSALSGTSPTITTVAGPATQIALKAGDDQSGHRRHGGGHRPSVIVADAITTRSPG